MILGNCIPIPFGKRSDAYQWDIINNFIADVIADGGTFEDAACMYQQIQHLLGQAYGGSNAYDEATLVLTANAWNTSIMYAVKRGVGLSDFPFTRALPAYRVNSDGDLELMGNNVPRLTYDTTYNGCPAYLFEPARTNLLTSKDIIGSASFGVIQATKTLSAEVFPLIPSAQVALITPTISTTEQGLRINLTGLLSINTNYCVSFWAKVVNAGSVGKSLKADISDESNATTAFTSTDWQFFEFYGQRGSFPTGMFSDIRTNSDTGNWAIGEAFLITEIQVEQGVKATSRLPASTLRPADVSTRSDLQSESYLGATSGAFYIDYENTSQAAAGSSAEIEVKKGILDGFQMQATLSGSVYCLSFRKLVGGVGTTIFTPSYSPANYRALVVYTATTISVYINGTKVVNDSAFTRTNDDFDTFNILGGGLYRKAIRTLAFSDVVPTEAQALAVCGFTNLDEYLGFINYTSDNPALYESYT